MAATLAGSRSVGPIANDLITAGHRHIGKRQAIDIDADYGQVGGNQVTGHARRRQACRRLAVVKCAVARAGRIGRPMRRAQALHAAAFLVDQHGRFPADNVSE